MSLLVLGDVLKLGAGERPQIIEGYVLRKATPDECVHISVNTSQFGGRFSHPYTSRFERKMGENGSQRLSESEWNYSVIEHFEVNPNQDLQLALMLANCDLHILYELTGVDGNYGFRIMPLSFFNYVQSRTWSEKVISSSDVLDISDKFRIITEFNKVRSNFGIIDKAREDLEQLVYLPFGTPFRFLAMFAIIESLLTHDPETGFDSLTRQLKTKIALLNNRFSTPINVGTIFDPSVKLPTVIDRLYKYRSTIAHGSEADFSKNDLKILKSKDIASDFLYLLLKRLVTQALLEPCLVSDLKNC